jgi:hypothetical protein
MPEKSKVTLRTQNSPLGKPGWIAVVVLTCCLAAALWYAIHAWQSLPGVAMSPLGWLFLILGALFTLAVGGGLMALLFYSSRHNHDR